MRARPPPLGTVDQFEGDYFEQRSTYAKFENQAEAATALEAWYSGLFTMLDRCFPGVLPSSGRVVELGCGHGAVLQLLQARGLAPLGCDLSAYTLSAIRTRDRDQPLLLADASSLAVAPGSLDAVLAFEVLEHVPRVEIALQEIHSALADGGRLIATTPNPFGNLIPGYDAWADKTHSSVFPPRRWRELLVEAGFKNARVKTVLMVPYLWRLSPRLSRAVLLPLVGPTSVIAARRCS